MDGISVLLATFSVIFVIICYIYFNKRSGKKAETAEPDADAAPEQRLPARREAVAVGGARRRTGRTRMQRTRDDTDEEDEDGEFEHVSLPEGKIGAKKMKKLQEKEEKRKMREAELQEREEQKVRDKLLEQQRLKEEKRKEAEEKEKEEEERKRKEEEEERAHQEYLKFKADFEMVEEGTHEDALNQNTESLLQSFIDYIKEMKVVLMEELAAHFKLRTQEAIDRIKCLQEEGRLSGVLDDRGKFIYITREEYEAVAKFIKQRGRVSISELAEFSNKLINLNPDNQETHNKLVSECVG